MNWMKNKPWLFCPQAVSLKLVPEGTEVGSMPFFVLKSAFVDNPDVSPINPFVSKGRMAALNSNLGIVKYTALPYIVRCENRSRNPNIPKIRQRCVVRRRAY